MADFSYSQDLELHRLSDQVTAEPEEFEHWEKLVRAAETQEGGLNRNSSPQAITATRDTYDRFLARFPLFFGYWKKYADLEFTIGGTEAAEMVYERGVASIGISVDLWANYCAFKIETSHDEGVIRELFDRAAECVGLDFLAHPFWDKYIEFEERLESKDRIFALLGRIIHIPLHQYARYFERYRGMAAHRSVDELAPKETITQFKEQVLREGSATRSQAELDRDVRALADAYHLKIFQQTQTETNKRWTYEQEIKRPYYHVTELDDGQLTNWTRYLDFEESEGDYVRAKFLYERCTVTCANYEEFWFRYARWTLGQINKPAEVRDEEVRNIYRRACCTYVYIARPEIRLQYARFEESLGRADVAIDILRAILIIIPGDLDTIICLVNVFRRQYGVDAAILEIKVYLDGPDLSSTVKGALVTEWARLVWTAQGDSDTARTIYQDYSNQALDCDQFWIQWLSFETAQPTSEKEEDSRYQRVKSVYEAARSNPHLPASTVNVLARSFLSYLDARGGKESMAEWTYIDMEINGPASVPVGEQASVEKQKHSSLGNSSANPYAQ